MLFGEEKDWKEFMCEDGQVELAELIEKAKKHRCAYMKADDVKVAQVWCALTEVSKDLKKMNEKLKKMEVAVRAVAEMGEIAKRQTLKEKVEEILKAKTKAEREEIEKIVDTLMEF